MKRIYVDGEIFRYGNYGGIARYWMEVLRAIQGVSRSYDPCLYLPGQTECPGLLNCRPCTGWPSITGLLKSSLWHTSYYRNPPWLGMGLRRVVTVYDLVDACYPEFSPNGEGFVQRQRDAIARAHAIIAISESTKTMVVDAGWAERERIVVAYPGVAGVFSAPHPSRQEIENFRSSLTGGRPYLLHVGRRRTYKNFETILRAFARAASQTERHLIVAGGPGQWTEEERDLIQREQLAARIQLKPGVDDDFLKLAYSGADAYVSASRMEGFGIPVIEAAACGCPLLLSDIPAFREVAGNFASFLPPQSLEHWARAMTEAVSPPAFSPEDVLKKFNWARAAEAHLAAYALADA